MNIRIVALVALAAPLLLSAQTSGRVYPERADDLAWENDLVAFRAYGPATQRRGEKAFGYDLFLKYPGKGPVLERLYGEQTSAANWAKVDSLRRVDEALAKDFENSFTYHIDHGYGMDCFAVGPTLGCGVAALALGDSICYPWCYDSVDIIENGPERFKAELVFAPVRIGADSLVTEHRLITLDAGTHLNRCEVWYEGLHEPCRIVVGFPVRSREAMASDSGEGIIAVADPTQGPDNGHIFLGAVCESPCNGAELLDGHYVLSSTLAPGERFVYNWGYAWNRTDIPDFDLWLDYLRTYKKEHHE